MAKSAYVQERLAKVQAEADQVAAEPPKAKPVPKPKPVAFDPEYPFSLTSTGLRIQRKWYYAPNGDYVGEAEPGMWAPELTSEQLREHKAALARQKAKASMRTRQFGAAPPPVPQKVIDNARENAEALRAEAYAE